MKSSKGHSYAFIIGDTYVIKQNPTNVTIGLPKEYKEISYVLEGSDEDEDDSDKSEEEEKVTKTIDQSNILSRRTWNDKQKSGDNEIIAEIHKH